MRRNNDLSIDSLIKRYREMNVKFHLNGTDLKVNAPKGALTSELIAELKEYKADIIRFMGKQMQDSAAAGLTTVTRDRSNYPLSFGQERLWFLQILDPDLTAYNIPSSLKLEGNLDISALKQSLRCVVSRHEILRTVFTEVEGQGRQHVLPSPDIELPLLDLSAYSEEVRDKKLQQAQAIETNYCFNLESGPLIRFNLIRWSDETHILLINRHHIISDGWSSGIFINELSQFYMEAVWNIPNSLQELPVQYIDFSSWQRSWLQTPEATRQIEYWRERLLDVEGFLELPIDFVRPDTLSYHGDKLDFKLCLSLHKKLHSFSRDHKVTPFMVLLSSYSLLLSRHCRSEDFVIGTPIAGRKSSETESMIGFFVNTLPLRIDLSEQPTVFELLQRIQKTCLDAYSNQDVPFEKIIDDLNIDRSASHSPLFQVMFAFNNTPQQSFMFKGLEFSSITSEHNTSKFDLTLFMWEEGTELYGRWEYNTQLFTKETISRLSKHFEKLLSELLEQAVVDPTVKANALPMLSEEETHHLIHSLNDTAVDYPSDKLIHELFEAQVSAHPDAIALVYQETQLSYQELNIRTNQLAHYLLSQGVKPDSLVGICLERSIEMVVAILGILKSGAAYVPLDPNYPQMRLQYMLEDTGLDIVITNSALQSMTPVSKTQALCVDSNIVQTLLTQQDTRNILVTETGLLSSHLAYVIYTSGSTGLPKGVLIEHKGLVNLSDVKSRLFEITPDSRVLQFATMSFDTSVIEWIMALTSGARLHLPSNNHVDELSAYVASQKISHAVLLPSVLNHLNKDDWSTVKCLIVGGENCDIETINRWQVGRKFYNVYGPTEATVFCTLGLMDKINDRTHMGKAINGVHIMILDSYQQMVPIGVPGELHIGGVGLARGYLNQAELTAEKFISNPFNDNPDERLYRTGDLVRWLANGNVEFMGRLDAQVKIRGFRIELGEIESVLMQCAELKETVVLAREDLPGEKRLVAYGVVQSKTEVDGAELESVLRSHVASQLPEYMVPVAFVLMDAMPVMPNGKVDRNALPAPDMALLQKSYVAPRTETERSLSAIWQTLLGIERIGIHDNFFSIGGNSLLVIRLISLVNNQLKLTLKVEDLFSKNSIKDLAVYIDSDYGNSDDKQLLVSFTNNDNKPTLFCFPGAGLTSANYYPLANELVKDYSLKVVDLIELFSSIDTPFLMEIIITRCVKLITQMQSSGPYYLLGHSFGGSLAFEVGLQLERQGQSVHIIMCESMLCHYAKQLTDKQKAKHLKVIDTISDTDIMAGLNLTETDYTRSELYQNEVIQSLIAAYKMQSRMLVHYKPSGVLKANIILIYGENSDSFLNELSRTVKNYKRYCENIEITPTSGEHLSMFHGKKVITLAENIVLSLAQKINLKLEA